MACGIRKDIWRCYLWCLCFCAHTWIYIFINIYLCIYQMHWHQISIESCFRLLFHESILICFDSDSDKSIESHDYSFLVQKPSNFNSIIRIIWLFIYYYKLKIYFSNRRHSFFSPSIYKNSATLGKKKLSIYFIVIYFFIPANNLQIKRSRWLSQDVVFHLHTKINKSLLMYIVLYINSRLRDFDDEKYLLTLT